MPEERRLLMAISNDTIGGGWHVIKPTPSTNNPMFVDDNGLKSITIHIGENALDSMAKLQVGLYCYQYTSKGTEQQMIFDRDVNRDLFNTFVGQMQELFTEVTIGKDNVCVCTFKNGNTTSVQTTGLFYIIFCSYMFVFTGTVETGGLNAYSDFYVKYNYE